MEGRVAGIALLVKGVLRAEWACGNPRVPGPVPSAGLHAFAKRLFKSYSIPRGRGQLGASSLAKSLLGQVALEERAALEPTALHLARVLLDAVEAFFAQRASERRRRNMRKVTAQVGQRSSGRRSHLP